MTELKSYDKIDHWFVKEPRDGKWSASNLKVDNLNGFVDMTGTLLKIGSDNTYLD